jgi:hypothetical protein
MEPLPVAFEGDREANENPKVPSGHKDSPDGVVQDQHFPEPNMPGTSLNFDGIAYPGVACFCAPPDTDGEVGLTQYVQIVNEGIQVFDKTTASVRAPWVFHALPASAAFENRQRRPDQTYDQLPTASRRQFAGSAHPTDECVAVSTTSDATGPLPLRFSSGTNFLTTPSSPSGPTVTT